MKVIALWLSVFLLQEVPYKPKEEFEIKLDYTFKQRPPADRTTVNLYETKGEYEKRTSNALLPYLVLNINLLKLNNETRLRVVNNFDQRIFNKKIDQGDIIPLDLGFTDDIKDGVTANKFVMAFLSPEKRESSKIVILIENDGSFFVNGEKRGKF